jgi:ATP-dependent DNA helicase PIF1
MLNPSQMAAFSAIVADQEPAFLTGSAGTGKTRVIHSLRSYYQSQGKIVYTMAPTALAASHIGGMTMHFFAGIKPNTPRTYDNYGHPTDIPKRARYHYREGNVWIIDEISMVPPYLLCQLLSELIYVRGGFKHPQNTEDEWTIHPGAYIKLILVGDFYQLPPIPDPQTPTGSQFVFQTALWKHLFPDYRNCFYLSVPMRQTSPDFLDLLRKLRRGVPLQPKHQHMIQDAMQRATRTDTVTRLCSRVAECDRFNQTQLDKLEHPLVVFPAQDTGSFELLSLLKKQSRLPQCLSIKEEAAVLLTSNQWFRDFGVFNGSFGIVRKILVEQHAIQIFFPAIQQELTITPVEEEVVDYKVHSTKRKIDTESATRRQFPLLLGWAITIHKSQGMTFDQLEITTQSIFAEGQLYTAVSRLRTWEGVRLVDWKNKLIQPSPLVKRYYLPLEKSGYFARLHERLAPGQDTKCIFKKPISDKKRRLPADCNQDSIQPEKQTCLHDTVYLHNSF